MEYLLAISALALAIIALFQVSSLRDRIAQLETRLQNRESATPMAAETALPCRHCGAPLSPGEPFCGACGTSVAKQPLTRPAVDRAATPLAQAPPSTALAEVRVMSADSTPPLPAFLNKRTEPQEPPPTAIAPRKPVLQPIADRVRSTGEWEALIGGRWMNRVGAVALILGLAFFFKYAMDNNWISESMRVGIGLLTGVLLVLGAWQTQKRDLAIFAQGLVGAGIGALYLSIYAAANLYHLIPQPMALVALAIIIAAAFLQALWYDSIAVALLAWAGGFLAVPLLGVTSSNEIGAIGYLVLLDVGILAVVVRRQHWYVLEPLAMGASYVTFASWYVTSYQDSKLVLAAIALSLFWALFYGMDVWRTVTRDANYRNIQHVLAAANPLAYFLGLAALLQEHRTALGLAVLALAAVYIGTILLARRGLQAGDRLAARYTATAVVLVIIATPILTSGFLFPILWSLEALALLAGGVRWRLPYVWWPATGLYVLAASATVTVSGALAYHPLRDFIPLLNPRALSFLVLAAALMAGARLFRSLEDKRAANLITVFDYAWPATIFTLLTVETIDFFGHLLIGAHGLDRLALEQQRLLVLALVWMLYSLPLVYSGLRFHVSPALSSGLVAVALAASLGAGAGLAYQPIERFVLVLNHRTVILVLLTACLVVHQEWLRRRERELPWIAGVVMAIRTVIVLLGFEIMTVEVQDYFRHASGAISQSAGPSGTFIEFVILAAVWMLYSIPLVRYGIQSRSLPILLTGLGSLAAGTVAGAVAAVAYQPATWLSIALTLRPLILLGLIACLLLQLQWLRQIRSRYAWIDPVILLIQASIVLLGFELITTQMRDVFNQKISTASGPAAADGLRNMEQLTLSILWMVYAIGLLIVGLWRRLRWLRLGSMALMGFVVAKIALYDLSFLNGGYRSLSFVGLGIVLLGASYLYQRYHAILLEDSAPLREEQPVAT